MKYTAIIIALPFMLMACAPRQEVVLSVYEKFGPDQTWQLTTPDFDTMFTTSQPEWLNKVASEISSSLPSSASTANTLSSALQKAVIATPAKGFGDRNLTIDLKDDVILVQYPQDKQNMSCVFPKASNADVRSAYIMGWSLNKVAMDYYNASKANKLPLSQIQDGLRKQNSDLKYCYLKPLPKRS